MTRSSFVFLCIGLSALVAIRSCAALDFSQVDQEVSNVTAAHVKHLSHRPKTSVTLPPSTNDPSDEDRVYNGIEANILQHSYMVSLRIGKAFGTPCGGVVIDRHHILTAAHCFINEKGNLKRGLRIDWVSFNSSKRGSWVGREEKEGSRVRIAQIYAPPTYRRATDLDVAILRLDIPPNQPTIEIYDRGSNEPCEAGALGHPNKALVLGWGMTGGLLPPKTLREAVVEVLPAQLCPGMGPTVICAGDRTTDVLRQKRDTGKGDSGGPLIQLLPAPRVIGITSHSDPNGSRNTPSGWYGRYTSLCNRQVHDFILAARTGCTIPRLCKRFQ